MIPRFGEAIVRSERYIARPGVYAVLPRDGQVMVTVQLDLEWELQLPGGGIDPGEQPLQALYREVLEETGWRIARPRRLGTFRRFVYMEEYAFWAEKICHVFVAHPLYQITEPTEAFHRSWFMDIDAAADEIGNDGDRHLLRRYRASLT